MVEAAAEDTKAAIVAADDTKATITAAVEDTKVAVTTTAAANENTKDLRSQKQVQKKGGQEM